MEEGTAMANDLFNKFLEDVTMQAEERSGWEKGMVSLPRNLIGHIDDLVIFPFGTFYHGIGNKLDPLTGYVAIGKLGEDYESSPVADSLTRQNLLIKIYDVLRDNEAGLRSMYTGTTLTRHGKLYFRHLESGAYYLEARSFLPVQTSRLILFYCTLEKLFWPFCQFLVHWASTCDVLEVVGQSDVNGLSQESLISMIIFFLVRKRIIPSYRLLHEWRNNSVTVDGVDVGFCENLEVVRKNCEQMEIGSVPSDWCLQRLLQLSVDFLHELSIFDFTNFAISPSTGCGFSKTQTIMDGNRRLATNSAMCVQELLDEFQNSTRRVTPETLLKLRLRCRHAGTVLQYYLWTGNMLTAVLSMLDKPPPLPEVGIQSSPAFLPDTYEFFGCKARCIQFRIPAFFLGLLHRCLENSEEDCPRAKYSVALQSLFFQLLANVNQVFWRKLAAKQIIARDGTANPIYFDGMTQLEEPEESTTKSLCQTLVSAVLANSAQKPLSSCAFYLVSDWSKKSNEILTRPVDDQQVKQFMKSISEVDLSKGSPLYGSRPGTQALNYVLASFELCVDYDQFGALQLTTVVTKNESVHAQGPDQLSTFLEWYNKTVKTWTIKRFTRWIGRANMNKLKKSDNVSQRPVGVGPIRKRKQGFVAMSTGMNRRPVARLQAANSSFHQM